MRDSFQLHRLHHDVDEHVLVVLECEDRPTVSIDVGNSHGRRAVSVRVNGMTIMSCLLDLTHLEGAGDRLARFCPFCGEKINMFSSTSHRCED